MCRFLYHLKKKVKNKCKVESSICEAYLVEEVSTFCSHYFEADVVTKSRRVGRNDDGGTNAKTLDFSIFNVPARPSGWAIERFLIEEEYNAACLYVL